MAKTNKTNRVIDADVIRQLIKSMGELQTRLVRLEKGQALPRVVDGGVPGLEGIVGRNGRAPYQSGDSKQMAKIRWLKG